MSDADDKYPALYLEGIEHFNVCDFYESHEVWEELWTDYRRAVLFDFTYPATAGAVELVHDRAWALAKSMLERSIAAIIDTDANVITPSA